MAHDYSSLSNAKRAWKTRGPKLGDNVYPIDVEYDKLPDGIYTVRVILENEPTELTNEDRDILEPFAVVYTPRSEPITGPSKTGPRAKMKPYSEWESSDVDGPCAVAWDIFDDIGRSHPRKEVIKACVDAGVHKNTAGVQYRRWRIKSGLDPRTRTKKK